MIEGALHAGRQAAVVRMSDACTIGRQVGSDTDEVTGAVVPRFEPVYAGPCRVKDVEAVVATPEAGGATITVRRVRLDIPAGSPRPAPGDVVEITASQHAPDVVGVRTRVVSVPVGSQATALRLALEEVS